MSNLDKLVHRALKDKAPSLLKELAANGKLRAFVKEKTEEINSLTTSLATEMAPNFGYNKTDAPMERARIMNGVMPMAREKALAEVLEFPPETADGDEYPNGPDGDYLRLLAETSRQNPARTIDSATKT